MRRSRAQEIPQRPSPQAPIRTSSSDSDPTHHRSRTERSPKLAGGRSPRGSQSDPVSQKKLGTRIADLESQLGQAQDELKCLKDQLSTAEAAKKAAQQQLEKKSRKLKKVANPVRTQEKHSAVVECKKESSEECEASDDVQKETDVFEVPVDSHGDEPQLKSSFDELALKNDEINSLKVELDEKEKELEILRGENAKMKVQLHEKMLQGTSTETQIEELNLNLNTANQELDKSKTREAQIKEKLEATEKAKEELESEMKRLRVQTEQWRKAADAAASVIAGEVEMNERRISERCGSMEKNYAIMFESGSAGGYGGYVGSPGGVDEGDDVFGSGKKKGSGIRIFGDLWKKKGHK